MSSPEPIPHIYRAIPTIYTIAGAIQSLETIQREMHYCRHKTFGGMGMPELAQRLQELRHFLGDFENLDYDEHGYP